MFYNERVSTRRGKHFLCLWFRSEEIKSNIIKSKFDITTDILDESENKSKI